MWIIPFKGRNHSGCYNQNFLWGKDNIYVMDNHRAALWCWFQHLDKNTKIDFFHIDKHTDTLQSKIDEWVSNCPDIWTITIDEYLGFIHERSMGLDIPLFRWDNYGSIFLNKYADHIENCKFATHDDGDEPNFKNVHKVAILDLAGNIGKWIDNSKNKWLINIDMDYFFYESDFEVYTRFQSGEYLDQLFKEIKIHLNTGKIACLTLCLSPEFCGGWDAAEKLCKEIVTVLGVEFDLPAKMP